MTICPAVVRHDAPLQRAAKAALLAPVTVTFEIVAAPLRTATPTPAAPVTSTFHRPLPAPPAMAMTGSVEVPPVNVAC